MKKIFVSSTFLDLVEYRKAVEEAINRLHQQHLMMEYFGSRPEEPKIAALKHVKLCDIFVAIYAHRYGSIPKGSRLSVTELEFNLARKLNKPIFIYRVSVDQPWLLKFVERGKTEKKLGRFMKRVDGFLRSEFTTPDNLAKQVAADLGSYLADQQQPSTNGLDTATFILNTKIQSGDFDVFFSYDHDDKLAVGRIATRLKEKGILAWFDDWELRPGFSRREIFGKYFKQMKSAAVFVGRKGIGPWRTPQEANFLREFAKYKRPIIPVVLASCAATPRFPPFVAGPNLVDFRKRHLNPIEHLVFAITGVHSPPKI